jgi:hypothetical protein
MRQICEIATAFERTFPGFTLPPRSEFFFGQRVRKCQQFKACRVAIVPKTERYAILKISQRFRTPRGKTYGYLKKTVESKEANGSRSTTPRTTAPHEENWRERRESNARNFAPSCGLRWVLTNCLSHLTSQQLAGLAHKHSYTARRAKLACPLW